MPQCYVSSCGNCYLKTRGNSSVIYHTFPTSPTRAKKWLEACGETKKLSSNHARVCSAHFSPKCYRRDLQHELLGLPLRKKLKSDAVPDINLPSHTSRDHNEIYGNLENAKIKKFSTRSSIRLAKIESHKPHAEDADRKVLQNSTNKIYFSSKSDVKNACSIDKYSDGSANKSNNRQR